MQRAIKEWLQNITTHHVLLENVGERLKLSYTVYGPLILLSPGSFESSDWRETKNHCSTQDFERLYEFIAKHLHATHIAINKPIPALEEDGTSQNVIRAPTNLLPLYGDFGPTTCNSPPSQEDFDAAFWVTAKQNGIFQTWAPRWTMFSRGNISEKVRLISLPSAQTAVEQGQAGGTGCAAVDLYAGIGYFAFSYLKAGFDKVLCWDLNPWSIEGLRRGAITNKWTTGICSESCSLESLGQSDARLLVFNESNEHATTRVEDIRHLLPQIRHVNCGLLPTSHGSWQTAVDVLDLKMGGWAHVHENFAIESIEKKAEDVKKAFQSILDTTHPGSTAKVEHINRLKSYAPGVMHCVLDLYIQPTTPR